MEREENEGEIIITERKRKEKEAARMRMGKKKGRLHTRMGRERKGRTNTSNCKSN